MSERFDVLIRGATLYDGTGAPPRVADVGVNGERIARVGAPNDATAASTIDARGLALAPGFIDVHTHDDFALVVRPEMDFKILGGVTTVVVGNCGCGAAWPAASRRAPSIRRRNDAAYMRSSSASRRARTPRLSAGAERRETRTERGRAELGHEGDRARRPDAGAVGFPSGLYEPGSHARPAASRGGEPATGASTRRTCGTRGLGCSIRCERRSRSPARRVPADLHRKARQRLGLVRESSPITRADGLTSTRTSTYTAGRRFAAVLQRRLR
jgi:hypothetical protein